MKMEIYLKCERSKHTSQLLKSLEIHELSINSKNNAIQDGNRVDRSYTNPLSGPY